VEDSAGYRAEPPCKLRQPLGEFPLARVIRVADPHIRNCSLRGGPVAWDFANDPSSCSESSNNFSAFSRSPSRRLPNTWVSLKDIKRHGCLPPRSAG
jgi:hypothetical protein